MSNGSDFESAKRYLGQKMYHKAAYILTQLDNSDVLVTNMLGYIYAQKEWTQSDSEKAIYYYEFGAKTGSGYALHGLGGQMMELGDKDTALKYYILGSDVGDKQCAFAAYHLLKQKKRTPEANNMLEVAARAGHPFALRNISIEMILGRRGIVNIIPGLVRWIVSVPKILSYAKGRSYYKNL